jgi:hypothetical protein
MVMNMRELTIIVTILNSLKDMSRFYMCRRSAVSGSLSDSFDDIYADVDPRRRDDATAVVVGIWVTLSEFTRFLEEQDLSRSNGERYGFTLCGIQPARIGNVRLVSAFLRRDSHIKLTY